MQRCLVLYRGAKTYYHFADFEKKFPATSARRPKEKKSTVSWVAPNVKRASLISSRGCLQSFHPYLHYVLRLLLWAKSVARCCNLNHPENTL